MKRILAILVLVFSFSAMAAEEQGNKIVIIGGKKFFPLQGARHFQEGSRPMLLLPPKNQPLPVRQNHQVPAASHNTPASVSKAPVAISHNNPLPPAQPSEGKAANTLSLHAPLPLTLPSENNTGSNNKTNPTSDVLSIFAPEDKAVLPPR